MLVQRFDAATALETIRTEGVTVVPGVPTMWVAFAELADAPADAFATVRLAYSGAARLPLTTMQRVADRFGLTVAEGYGLTEASPIVTSSSGLAPQAGSVGAVLDGVELRVVDERGDDVLVGDAGEIWVRGDNVFKGYLDDPEATARVLTPDGWLRTGDIGYCDDDGRLYLVDRAKDLVIVSGFNVFPAEVEEVLAEHPAVAEVGVVGVPHPQTGEAVQRLRGGGAGSGGRRRRAGGVRPRPPRPLQVPEQGRVRRRTAAQRRRQARSSPAGGRGVSRAAAAGALLVKARTSGVQ